MVSGTVVSLHGLLDDAAEPLPKERIAVSLVQNHLRQRLWQRFLLQH